MLTHIAYIYAGFIVIPLLKQDSLPYKENNKDMVNASLREGNLLASQKKAMITQL